MAITLDGTTGITTPSDNISGNLTFTGTGNRITGDFSNATVANRIFFQSSTTNGATHVNAFPNGTGTSCSFRAYSTSDPANAAIARVAILDNSSMTISSESAGTGTLVPMTFQTGGSEKVRIDTNGNLLVGITSGSSRLYVRSAGSTNASTCIYADNSSGTTLFNLRSDGYLTTGTAAASPYNVTTANAANLHVLAADGGLYRSTSSIKYKTNVQNATHGLFDLLKLRPVSYQGKNEIDGDKTFGGLIAEEVHEAGLTEFVQYAEDGSPDALAYGNMVSLCIKAIQEQQAIITALTARIEALEVK